MLITILLVINLLIFGVTLANVALWPRLRRATGNRPGEVSVLIPARNEESNLPSCLDAVLNQGETVLEILVYNDHSTDDSANVIKGFAERDRRVRAIEPVPLGSGWVGKNFACSRLASESKGKWLLFIDADAQLAESAVERMVEEMRVRRLKFLSCWPGLEMGSFWERALMPMLNFVVLTIFPAPLSLILDRPSLGLAHGACLMIERESYFSVGGHSAVRDRIFEDCSLARLWRERGERSLCLDGQDVVRVRMYESFGEIWRGFQKNFFPAFRHEMSFWAFITLHLLVFLLPWFLLIAIPCRTAALVVVIIFGARVSLALRFRHPAWAAPLHPVGELILISIAISSWRRIKSGRGVDWRGRKYYSSPRAETGE